MVRQLELVDALVADGREEFTFEEARTALGASPTATANALRRLQRQGLVDAVTRGHYVVRPLGSLGTSTASESLSLAVGAAFEGRPHRVAYLSALSELGLLSHPVRKIYVACVEQVRLPTVARRPVRVVVEKLDTIHLEAERVGSSWRSTLNRALFDAALRVDLTGSVERLAEALVKAAPDADVKRIRRVVRAFGSRGLAAERRLASIAWVLGLDVGLDPTVERRRPVIKLDPRDHHVEWVDDRYRVAWNTTVDELRAVVGN
jgi:predicted transcriptional regulator of viral defense system